jgi:hypothetical protein
VKSFVFAVAWFLAVLVPPPAFASLPAAAAQAGDGGNIAILDFKPNNASAGDAVTISEFVRAAFVRAGVYTVVDKANMERILAEQAFQQTGCTDSDCAVKLGKLLNVQKMVLGNYSVMGSVRFLTASLVDVQTGRIERTGKVKGFDIGNADEAADDLARQLTAGTESAMADKAGRKAEAEAAAREQARKDRERLKAERDAEADRRRGGIDAARIARGRIGVGLNYPGLGLRALLGNRWMVEAKGQYEKEAQAYGGRVYLYVFPGNRVYPYLGTEGDLVKYAGDGMNADGYLVEPFAGLEYFMWKRLSLQFDFGPAWVGLEEGAVAIDELRYVVNIGLTVYF